MGTFVLAWRPQALSSSDHVWPSLPGVPEQAVLLRISSLSLPRLLVNYTGKLLAWQPPGQALAGTVPLSEQNLGSIMR